MDKTFWGTQIIVFLGILINMVSQTISIAVDKREKAMKFITEIVELKKVTVLQLQKVRGLLNFLLKAIFPGRAFTRRLYAKFSDLKLKQHYHVKMEKGICGDLLVWSKFLKLDSSVCRPFLDFTHKFTADEIDFFTDASRAKNLGFRCVFRDHWTFAK